MKDDRLYLVHIVECLRKIQSYTVDGEEFFRGDDKTQDAVVRNFEVIGEAAKRVSPETRAQASEVPWKSLAGFRDVLIHQYEGVDLDQVWNAVDRDLPSPATQIEDILRSLEASADE